MLITKPLKNPEILIKSLGNEALLYTASGKEIHVLNAAAQVIWEFCDGEHTLEDVENLLKSRFSIPEDRDVRADIRQTIKIFGEKGLLAANGNSNNRLV